MGTLFRDVRFASRFLVRQPGFTAAAVISLALGLGANSALFSVFNSLLWRPLPVEAPDAITALYTTRAGQTLYAGFSYPDYRDVRSSARSTRVPRWRSRRGRTRSRSCSSA